jgi:hypothetical protein
MTGPRVANTARWADHHSAGHVLATGFDPGFHVGEADA